MKKIWGKFMVGLALCALMTAGLVLAGDAQAATTLEVGTSGYAYTKIQDAINAANGGDTVLVHECLEESCLRKSALVVEWDEVNESE